MGDRVYSPILTNYCFVWHLIMEGVCPLNDTLHIAPNVKYYLQLSKPFYFGVSVYVITHKTGSHQVKQEREKFECRIMNIECRSPKFFTSLFDIRYSAFIIQILTFRGLGGYIPNLSLNASPFERLEVSLVFSPLFITNTKAPLKPLLISLI